MDSDFTGVPAYRRYMEHRSQTCTCHLGGPGLVRSSIRDDGERVRGTTCPKGLELWQSVREEAAVRLTDYWEAVTMYPGMEPEKWEASELSTCVGVHLYCDGFMDIKRVAESWNAICCRNCHLRAVVPLSVKTVAQLREWAIVRFCRWNEGDEELAGLVRDGGLKED